MSDLLKNLTALSSDKVPNSILTLDEEGLEYIRARIKDAFNSCEDDYNDSWTYYWDLEHREEIDREVEEAVEQTIQEREERRKAEWERQGTKYELTYNVWTGQATTKIIPHGWGKNDIEEVTTNGIGEVYSQSNESEEVVDWMFQTFISIFLKKIGEKGDYLPLPYAKTWNELQALSINP